MAVTSQVQNAYEQQYRQKQGNWREIGAKQKALNIIELAHELAPQKVLEVGAGDGSILWHLSQQNFAPELYAVEIAESAIALIKERQIPQLHRVLPFDGYTLPFADQSIDLVILSHVLEHVEFERKLLRELQRVARYCVLEVPKDYRRGIDKRINHFLSYGHINVYTPTSLRFLLRTEGFQILNEKISVYSKETYRMTYGKGLFSTLLYLFKKSMVSLPIPFIRDYFANTITVLLKTDTQKIKIF